MEKKHITAVSAVLAAGMLVAWLLLPDPAMEGTASSIAQTPGTKSAPPRGRARPTPRPWAFLGPRALKTPIDYEVVLQEPRSPLDELRDGNEAWAPTLIALEATPDSFEIYRDCMEAHLGAEEVCEYTLERVLEPPEDHHGPGNVAYASAEPADDMSDGCAAYAACVAEMQAGREAPLPDGVTDPVGMRETTRDARNDPVFRNTAVLRQQIAQMTEDLELARELDNPEGLPEWDYSLAHEEADLEWRIRLLAELEAMEDEGP